MKPLIKDHLSNIQKCTFFRGVPYSKVIHNTSNQVPFIRRVLFQSATVVLVCVCVCVCVCYTTYSEYTISIEVCDSSYVL